MSFDSMKNRIDYLGGFINQDRMIKDKARSLLSAIRTSYQSARFKKYPKLDFEFKGLFNPVANNENFDTKMISVPWKTGYEVGDIFYWENTDTYWICFLQDKSELAYFRGECRRCDHKISWVSQEREVIETLVSVIGPDTPTLRTSSSMQAQVAEDFPNATIQLLIQDNEQNRTFFGRYQKFFIKGVTYQIEQLDVISMPGIIQAMATEHYTNAIEDDTEENLRNAWNVQPIIDDHPTEYAIIGDPVIKPIMENTYSTIMSGGEWLIMENINQPIDKKSPAKFISTDLTAQEITLIWDSVKSGQFTLGYRLTNGNIYQRHIIVESLM